MHASSAMVPPVVFATYFLQFFLSVNVVPMHMCLTVTCGAAATQAVSVNVEIHQFCVPCARHSARTQVHDWSARLFSARGLSRTGFALRLPSTHTALHLQIVLTAAWTEMDGFPKTETIAENAVQPT